MRLLGGLPRGVERPLDDALEPSDLVAQTAGDDRLNRTVHLRQGVVGQRENFDSDVDGSLLVHTSPRGYLRVMRCDADAYESDCTDFAQPNGERGVLMSDCE